MEIVLNTAVLCSIMKMNPCFRQDSRRRVGLIAESLLNEAKNGSKQVQCLLSEHTVPRGQLPAAVPWEMHTFAFTRNTKVTYCSSHLAVGMATQDATTRGWMILWGKLCLLCVSWRWKRRNGNVWVKASVLITAYVPLCCSVWVSSHFRHLLGCFLFYFDSILWCLTLIWFPVGLIAPISTCPQCVRVVQSPLCPL